MIDTESFFFSGASRRLEEMVDAKRVGYILLLVLIIGLALVRLRTGHIQTVYQAIEIEAQKQQIKQDLWQQRAILSERIESLSRVKQRVNQLGLPLVEPGEKKQEDKKQDDKKKKGIRE